MNTEKTSLEAQNQPSCLGAIMRSNIRLLIWGWCVMWDVIGGVFTVLWLWRYFT